MKKVFLLITVLVSLISFSWVDGATAQERLSREQFKIKQQTYLMEKAGLTRLCGPPMHMLLPENRR